jgi:hypothetical protein
MTVLIHAGMPKTGSTSIQAWLRLHHASLRDRYGVQILQEATAPDGSGYHLEPFSSAVHINANLFLVHYAGALNQKQSEADRQALAETFTAALDRAASELGTVLITSEGFSALFHRADAPFLGALDRLAEKRTVRVAYYVRPQHSALEARWREWGFRNGIPPSQWVQEQLLELHYRETLERVRALAPAIDFEMRLFRSDLLPDGNVVTDFASSFLRLDEPPDASGVNVNPGMPLDLVNRLRFAPRALLDTPARASGGWRQGELGPISQAWGVPESDEAVTSRRLLHRFAYESFEDDNRVMLAALSSPIPWFIPTPDIDDAIPFDELLGQLDRLWMPAADETTLAYLYAALDALWSNDH